MVKECGFAEEELKDGEEDEGVDGDGDGDGEVGEDALDEKSVSSREDDSVKGEASDEGYEDDDHDAVNAQNGWGPYAGQDGGGFNPYAYRDQMHAQHQETAACNDPNCGWGEPPVYG